MTEPVEDYLCQLRAGLRTRPEETCRILAEAEDHLRESVAAGLAAGMTQTEAAKAAVSCFGTVRDVVRAHQTLAGRAVTAIGRCARALWWMAGAVLSAGFLTGVVMVIAIAAGGPLHGRPDPPHLGFGQLVNLTEICGWLSVALLGSYFWSHGSLRPGQHRE